MNDETKIQKKNNVLTYYLYFSEPNSKRTSFHHISHNIPKYMVDAICTYIPICCASAAAAEFC
jgi:predicted HAD superfamily hydrolase